MSHLIPVNADGHKQLPLTQVPPFRQEKSLGQAKYRNKGYLLHNISAEKTTIIRRYIIVIANTCDVSKYFYFSKPILMIMI